MDERSEKGRGGWRMGQWVSASLLAVLLSGCSDLGLFSDTKTVDDGAYPNLGSVPARPAPRTDAGERAAAREGLAADRANARYSADPIRRPYPEGAAGALPPDGNFPAQSTFRPTDAPIGSAPVSAPAAIPPQPMRPGEVQPSSQGLPPVPPTEPRQPLPEPPPPPPADLVPQAAPPSVPVAPLPAPPAPTPALPLSNSGTDIDARLDAMLAAAGGDAPGARVIGEVGGAPSLATLYFRDGSAGLDGQALSVLKQVAAIQKSRGQRLVLVGHASRRAETNDAVKRETFNQKISVARAENTRKALRRLGVKDLMVTVRAAGDQAAAFDEAAPAGEAANRKVEIYLED